MTWSTIPWRPPIMFWITVGHASRHTARAMGPSTIDRSSLRAGCAIAARSYFSVAAATSQRPVAGTSYQLPVTSYQVASFQRRLVTRYWRLVTGDWRLATGDWLLATGYWLLATGYWLLATGYWLLATGTYYTPSGRQNRSRA